MPSNSATALGWCGLAFNVILANVIGHGLYTVYSKRNAIQWSARHFDQLFYGLIWSILFVGVALNLQLCEGILELFDLGFVGRWFLNNLFGIGFLGLWLLRAWLVHYDFHSGVAMFNLVSNPDLDDQQREHLQWFIDNKVTYGSPKYLTRFTLVTVLIINAIMLAFSAIAEQAFIYAVVFIYFVLVIIAIGITRHIILLDDNFFVRQELLIEFRIMAVAFIQAGVWVIFAPGMGWNWASFFLTMLCAITVSLMCFVATYWVLRKTREVGLDSPNGTLVIELPDNIPPLGVALKDEKIMNKFIKHLVNEISVENIFFLSDVMAFKKTFVKFGKLKQVNGFVCPVGTKLARLVFRRTYTHYAWAVSKTYIDGTSSLYVTAISDEVREATTDALEDLDPAQETDSDHGVVEEALSNLQTIFDQCGEEVFKELEHAYARFSYTQSFQTVNFQNAGGDAGSGSAGGGGGTRR